MEGISFSEIGSWLATFAVPAVAAFAGAWFAFRLNVRQKKQEEDRRRVEQGQKALYTIFNMWDILFQYKKDIIDPHKDNDDCSLEMHRTSPMTTGLTSFDAEGLAFLLTLGKEEANVYAQVLIEEQRFGNILSIIEKRNMLLEAGIRVVFIPGEEKAVIHPEDNPKAEELKTLTDGIVSQVGDSIKSLENKQDILKKTMKGLYPKETFITFHPLPERKGGNDGKE